MSLEKFKHKRSEQAFWFQRYKCCVIDLVCIKPGMKRAGAIIRIWNTLQRSLYKRFGPQPWATIGGGWIHWQVGLSLGSWGHLGHANEGEGGTLASFYLLLLSGCWYCRFSQPLALPWNASSSQTKNSVLMNHRLEQPRLWVKINLVFLEVDCLGQKVTNSKTSISAWLPD